jgi:hypothetical protein
MRHWMLIGLAAAGIGPSLCSALPLSARFEEELGTQEWRRAYAATTPAWTPPGGDTRIIRVELTDAATGRHAPLLPAVAYEVDGRQRWGGRQLGVDWVLVADGVTNDTLRLSLLLKSDAEEPRLFSVDLGVDATLEGWIWHRDLFDAQPLARSAPAQSWHRIVGAGHGRQSFVPFGVVSSNDLQLIALTDAEEPRLFEILADPARRFLGVRHDLALSPETAAFPGRAVLRATLHETRSDLRPPAQALRRWQAIASETPHADAPALPLLYTLDDALPVAPEWADLWPVPAATQIAWRADDAAPRTPDADDLQQARLRSPDAPVTLTYPPALEADALDAALYWGFLPEPDAADPRAQWAKELARAGWQPAGPMRVHTEGVFLEHHGAPTSNTRFVTLYNRNPFPVIATLSDENAGDRVALVDPISEQRDRCLSKSDPPTWHVLLPARRVAVRAFANNNEEGAPIVSPQPLHAWRDSAATVTGEDDAFIPVHVSNLDTTEHELLAHVRNSPDGEAQRFVLPPFAHTRIHVQVPRDGVPDDGLVRLHLASGSGVFFETNALVHFLDEADSIARDTRVRVEASSTQAGYQLAALTDGRIADSPSNLWHDTWASADLPIPHRIRLTFPAPTAIRELRFFWPDIQGGRQSARALRISALTAAGTQATLAQIEQPRPVSDTRIAFDPIQVEWIEVEMPAGRGAATSPNLLWLGELEVR